jgi:hypothetical protein
MSHMSVFRAYWRRPILGGKSILGIGLFWEEIIFWEKDYFWRERFIFGARAIVGRKETCEKRRRINMQKEGKKH